MKHGIFRVIFAFCDTVSQNAEITRRIPSSAKRAEYTMAVVAAEGVSQQQEKNGLKILRLPGNREMASLIWCGFTGCVSMCVLLLWKN